MKTIFALTAFTATALAGCSDIERGFPSFNREAGAAVNTGDFGSATMQNTQIMSGEQGYTLQMAHRFAAEVDSTVNFAFNSAVLDAQAQAILLRQADWIRQFPEVKFKVFGHTDLVGPAAYNQRLGLRRAQAVVAFLTSHGISRTRLQAVVSYGETQPLIVTEGRERANRRTVTEVTGFVSGGRGAGMGLNGKYAEVIFREYVASATPRPALTQTTGADLSTSN